MEKHGRPRAEWMPALRNLQHLLSIRKRGELVRFLNRVRGKVVIRHIIDNARAAMKNAVGEKGTHAPDGLQPRPRLFEIKRSQLRAVQPPVQGCLRDPVESLNLLRADARVPGKLKENARPGELTWIVPPSSSDMRVTMARFWRIVILCPMMNPAAAS